MENSHIEWTDHTWNPWIGCTKVDALCAHCYAEARDIRFADGAHWGKGAPRQRTSLGNWREPYRWNRDAGIKAAVLIGRRPRVFSASLADWLDDEVPIAWLVDMLQVVNKCRNLNWLLLTKRPENWKLRLGACVSEALKNRGADSGPTDFIQRWLRGDAPEHVWVGTSVGNQESADKRIPELLEIPAKIRFLSCEPLLGPVDLSLALQGWDVRPTQPNGEPEQFETPTVDWVIAGGESGKGARPMHPNWAKSLRDQCVAAKVPFFFKQWGEHSAEVRPGVECEVAKLEPHQSAAWGDGATNHVVYSRVGKKAAGALLDGREWKEFPA